MKRFKLLKYKWHYSNSGSIIFIILVLLFIYCEVFFFINSEKEFALLLKSIIIFNPPLKENKTKKVDRKSMPNYSSIQSISTNIKINIPRLTLDINSRKGEKTIDKKIKKYNTNNLSKISESKVFNKKNRKITNKNKKEKQIKANNKNQLIKKNYYNDFELNVMKYQQACLYDKRTYLQYYWSLLRKKNLIIFIFAINDYNIYLLLIYYKKFGI